MPQSGIDHIDAIEILDCRGDPTVRVTLGTGDVRATADVPAGKSTGGREAKELRDRENRYSGFGVRTAVAHVTGEIGEAVLGMDPRDQREIDRTLRALDGTEDKARLGANAILGVSLAAARLGAALAGVPLYRYLNPSACVLPVPLVNLINGGAHASNDLEFQEFCIFPVGAASFAESMEISHAVNQTLRGILSARYGKISVNVGDEGGFAPPISSPIEALDQLAEAVEKSGMAAWNVLGLDCAATHLFDAESRTYTLDGKRYDTDELLAFYAKMVADYGIKSIEDPFDESDVDGFAKATATLGIQIVGDDFFCTNPAILRERHGTGAANALLWKVNQIGTLSEAVDAAELAFRSGFGVMVSERSGETEDPIISDLVVALNAGQIKTGAPIRSERTVKYNRLLEIERELGANAVYAGEAFQNPFLKAA